MKPDKLDFAVLASARETACGPDVVPLHALCGPLASSLQSQLAHQYAVTLATTDAIQYILSQSLRNQKLAAVLDLTEAQERLVTALAKAMLCPRAVVAKVYRAHHDPSESYGCIDDPQEAA